MTDDLTKLAIEIAPCPAVDVDTKEHPDKCFVCKGAGHHCNLPALQAALDAARDEGRLSNTPPVALELMRAKLLWRCPGVSADTALETAQVSSKSTRLFNETYKDESRGLRTSEAFDAAIKESLCDEEFAKLAPDPELKSVASAELTRNDINDLVAVLLGLKDAKAGNVTDSYWARAERAAALVDKLVRVQLFKKGSE